MSDKRIDSITASSYTITPESSYYDTKITYNHGTIVNEYIVYELSSNLNNFNFALENCSLGVVKLTKNADIDKYKYFE